MVESSPTPCTSRANYGFALYLASYSVFGLYLIWTILPDFILEHIGLTFLPQKYWSIGIPLHACVSLALLAFVFYPALNLTLVPDRNDLSIITDDYANYEKIECHPDGVPSAHDVALDEVCESLFLYF